MEEESADSEDGFHVSCEDYGTYQSYGFVKLLEDPNERFTDVTICYEGQRLEAHKTLLVLCSEYFKALFKEMNQVGGQGKCVLGLIGDIKFEDLKNVIHFMYYGQVQLKSANELSSFIKTADFLKINGISNQMVAEYVQHNAESTEGTNSASKTHVDAAPSTSSGVKSMTQLLSNSQVNSKAVSNQDSILESSSELAQVLEVEESVLSIIPRASIPRKSSFSIVQSVSKQPQNSAATPQIIQTCPQTKLSTNTQTSPKKKMSTKTQTYPMKKMSRKSQTSPQRNLSTQATQTSPQKRNWSTQATQTSPQRNLSTQGTQTSPQQRSWSTQATQTSQRNLSTQVTQTFPQNNASTQDTETSPQNDLTPQDSQNLLEEELSTKMPQTSPQREITSHITLTCSSRELMQQIIQSTPSSELSQQKQIIQNPCCSELSQQIIKTNLPRKVLQVTKASVPKKSCNRDNILLNSRSTVDNAKKSKSAHTPDGNKFPKKSLLKNKASLGNSEDKVKRTSFNTTKMPQKRKSTAAEATELKKKECYLCLEKSQLISKCFRCCQFICSSTDCRVDRSWSVGGWTPISCTVCW